MPNSKVKIRNPVVRAAASLMAKGGAHTRSPSSNRRQVRQAIDDELQDYLAERETERSENIRGKTVAPGNLHFVVNAINQHQLSCSVTFSR